MSLKQDKKVGKDSSPKTKRVKHLNLPSEQLTRLAVLARHTLNILDQTSGNIGVIVRKERRKLADQHCEKDPEQQMWVIEALTQLQGIAAALKAVSNHARWELFERVEPPLIWEVPMQYKEE